MLCILMQHHMWYSESEALDLSGTVVASEGGYFIYCWGNNEMETPIMYIEEMLMTTIKLF